MKKLASLLLAAAMLCGLAACGATGTSSSAAAPASSSADAASAAPAEQDNTEPVHLLIATTSPNTTGEDVGPYTGQKAIVTFMRSLEEISGGKMTAECSWGGALGNSAQLFAQTTAGDIDIHMCGLDTLTALKSAEDTAIFSVPYVFDDFDHVKRYTDSESFTNLIAAVEQANGLHWMGILAPSMPRSLNSVQPITSPDDLKNMKIRVAESAASVAVWTAWGANPIVIPATEVYSALENNNCDGWENSISAFYSMKTYEVAPYITEIDYVQQGICCLMSQKTWDSLNDEQKDWVQQAMDKAYDTAMDISYGSGVDGSGVTYYDSEKQKFADDPDCDATFVEEFDLEAFQSTALEAARGLEGDLFTEGLIDAARALAEE